MILTSVICVLLAAFFNAAWSAASKPVLRNVAPLEFTLKFRLVTALLLFPFFVLHFDASVPISIWILIAWAGLLETLAIVCQSRGVRKDYYSTFALINTSPLFVLFLAPGLLNESLSATLVIGVFLIVAGVWIFFAGGSLFSLMGLLGAILFAVMNVCSKAAIDATDAYFFSFIQVFMGAIFFVPVVMFRRREREKKGEPKPRLKAPWRFIAYIGIMSFIATLLFNIAISLSDITRVSSLVRTNILFGFLLSYFVLREQENAPRKIAAGLVICAGTILVTIA